MPRHDFRCDCGRVVRDVYLPVSQRATEHPPTCDACGMLTTWIPAVGRMDAGSGPGFTSFETEVLQPDGTHKTTRVGSLSDLRRIERDSEQRQRNGEGQAMIWRDYSQSPSNRHVHTMGEAPSEAPSAAAIAKFGPSLRRSAEEPTAALGPGVTDESSSVFADV